MTFDPTAEAAVIGSCLLSGAAMRWAAEWLRAADFHQPKWREAFEACVALYAEGGRVDAVTVADRARLLGLHALAPSNLVEAQAEAPAPSAVAHYGHIVRRLSVARGAAQMCRAAAEEFQSRENDPDELVDRLLADLRSIDAHVPVGPPAGFATFEALRAKPADQRAPWVIPGLLRRDWRAMFVGTEGSGKTTLLRQLAVTSAAGMHPFIPSESVSPVRTLLVDLENPEDHLLDWVDRISRHAENFKHKTEGRGAVWHRPGGIDVRKRVWRGQFEEVLRDHQPDLVCLGPMYKAFLRRSKETEEEAAGEVQEIFDDLRTRYRFALVMEHHPPKGQAGVRDLAPFGSSLWLRWGEIRMSLVPPDKTFPVMEMELRPFSGSRVEHAWPQHLDRNRVGGLPWIGRYDRDEF